MKRIIFAIVLLIASMIWGQKDSTMTWNGKEITNSLIGAIPTIWHLYEEPKNVLSPEFKKALDGYFLNLLKEYKESCEKDSWEIFHWASEFNLQGEYKDKAKKKSDDAAKPTFEGFINWLERKTK